MAARAAAAGGVAVVVVNFDGAAYISRCLSALAQQTLGGFSTIVVDNGSRDGSPEIVARDHPEAVLIRAGANIGFAAGNNLGIRHAGNARWIVLLNPDAFPQPRWLETLLAAAEANPDFSFFGCRMRLAGALDRLDGTGDELHASGMAWRRDHGRPVSEGARIADEIFGPCAAAALYSRAAMSDAGGFDERYFCYHEDVDLAFRLRLRGHRCLYVPDAVVDHVSSGISGRRSDFATYHGHRNLVWTYAKDMPGLLFWLFLPLHFAMTLAAAAVCAVRGQLGVFLRAKRDAIAGLGDVLAARRAVQAGRRIPLAALLAVLRFGPRRR